MEKWLLAVGILKEQPERKKTGCTVIREKTITAKNIIKRRIYSEQLCVIQTFIRLFLTDYRHIKCHAEGNYFDDGQSSDLIKQIL